MKSYSVARRGQESVLIEAENWLVALGKVVDRLGGAEPIERLACEVLPNGTAIAREAETGVSYVIQPVLAQNPVEASGASGEVVEEEFAVGDGDADRLDEILQSEGLIEACELAMNLAQERVGAESASVILLVEDKLKFVAVAGPHSESLIHVEMPLGTGVAGYSAERGRPVVLGDAAADERHFDGVDRLTGQNTREMACVPVTDGEQVFGVLELLNLPDQRRFSRDNIQQMQVVAETLARRLASE